MARTSDPAVAIIGAGPFGLSIAAHLRHCGIDFRIFGTPMLRWRTQMPAGMFLKSAGFASSLADPSGRHTLRQFCTGAALPYEDGPVPIETFNRYALTFQQSLVPMVEDVAVVAIDRRSDLFEVRLATGEQVRARKVVVATGLSYAAYVPRRLSELPNDLLSHSSDHGDLARFKGRNIVVVGAGQSALETAALLNEGQATVTVLARRRSIQWIPPPSPDQRSLWDRLRQPASPLGDGLRLLFCSEAPMMFYQLPENMRVDMVRRLLDASGAHWLRERVVSRLPVLTGYSIRRAQARAYRAELHVNGPSGRSLTLSADHVIAATGYHFAVRSLPFLSEKVLAHLRCIDQIPSLSRSLEFLCPGPLFLRAGEHIQLWTGDALSVRRSLHRATDVAPSGCRAWLPTATCTFRFQSGYQSTSTPMRLPSVSRTGGGPVPALILKTGHYPVHHGGLGVIRSLGMLGVPVYSVVEDRFVPAALSRYLAGAIVWDTRGLRSSQLLEGLSQIGSRLGRPTVLIPTDDFAAIFIAKSADALRPWFVFPTARSDLARILANKKLLHALCTDMGVPCPWSIVPGSIADVKAFIEKTGFPVVVKAPAAWLPSTFPTTVVHSWQEMRAICGCAEFLRSTNLLIQQYIPGNEDWFFHGYCNTVSDCLAGFTGRKLRSSPPDAGFTTLGRSVINDPLRRHSEAVLKNIRYAGIVDIDYRFDSRDGQYKLLDFNPRLGAQFRLFDDGNGLDVVRALYRDLTGEPVRGSGQIDGRSFIVELHDLRASLHYVRHRELSLRQWWRSLAGPKELAWFRWNDPLPFLMMWIRLAVGAAIRQVKPVLARLRRVAKIPLATRREPGRSVRTFRK